MSTSDFVRVTKIPGSLDFWASRGVTVGGVYRVVEWVSTAYGDRFPVLAFNNVCLAWEKDEPDAYIPRWELVDLRRIKRVRITSVPHDYTWFRVGDVAEVRNWDTCDGSLYPVLRGGGVLANADGSDLGRRPGWEPVPDEPPAARPTADEARAYTDFARAFPSVQEKTENLRAAFKEPPAPRAPVSLLGSTGCADLLRHVLCMARGGTKRDAALTCWSIVSLLATALGEPVVEQELGS